MLFVTELNICSGIEEVITSTTGNRVVVKSGTRVRIPPTAPVKNPVTMPVTGFSSASKWGFDHDFDHKRGY
jgi:hypothetical protein